MSIDSIGSNSTVNLLGMDDVVALELGGNVEAEVSQTLVQSARFQRNQGELERAGTEERLANAEQRRNRRNARASP
ncbi:MAG: hypothetical protein QM756_36935 [Polyangiaceae bacterium]